MTLHSACFHTNARVGSLNIDKCIYKTLYISAMNATAMSGFEWDDDKLGKCRKHGLKIADIESVFQYAHHLTPDVAHSSKETRFLAIGRGSGQRLIFVAFTMRKLGNKRLIRPISARYMHQKEVDHYEQAIAKTEQ